MLVFFSSEILLSEIFLLTPKLLPIWKFPVKWSFRTLKTGFRKCHNSKSKMFFTVFWQEPVENSKAYQDFRGCHYPTSKMWQLAAMYSTSFTWRWDIPSGLALHISLCDSLVFSSFQPCKSDAVSFSAIQQTMTISLLPVGCLSKSNNSVEVSLKHSKVQASLLKSWNEFR